MDSVVSFMEHGVETPLQIFNLRIGHVDEDFGLKYMLKHNNMKFNHGKKYQRFFHKHDK